MSNKHIKIRKKFKHINSLPIIKRSGYMPKFSNIEIAKKHRYTVITDISITGDAPKDIIRYYEYGIAQKNKLTNIVRIQKRKISLQHTARIASLKLEQETEKK